MEGRFNRDLIPKVSSKVKSATVILSTSLLFELEVGDNFVVSDVGIGLRLRDKRFW